MEKALCGGLGAVGPNPKFRDVQIHLENPPLRPASLDQHGEIGFKALAKVAAPGPQKQVLGDLLADGAGAPHFMAVLVELVGFFDGRHVKAPVSREFLILGGDHGQRHVRRYAVQGDPVVGGGIARIALHPSGNLGLSHEGAERRVDPAQQ